jgi:hypothetical protein
MSLLGSRISSNVDIIEEVAGIIIGNLFIRVYTKNERKKTFSKT